jgi:DtxR family Mn-dependent transcriptional regulator
MELTNAHLRYLLCIYELSRSASAVSSAEIAVRLKVTKPSVSRMLAAMMEKELLMKERYGKVYLTEEGASIARGLEHNIAILAKNIPKMQLDMTPSEVREAACAIVSVMPAGKRF